jgi:hypothetical protein
MLSTMTYKWFGANAMNFVIDNIAKEYGDFALITGNT